MQPGKANPSLKAVRTKALLIRQRDLHPLAISSRCVTRERTKNLRMARESVLFVSVFNVEYFQFRDKISYSPGWSPTLTIARVTLNF